MSVKINDKKKTQLVNFKQRAHRTRTREYELELGINEEEGAKMHPDADMTIAELGARHEDGIGVPKRIWLRSFIAKHASLIASTMNTIARDAKVEEQERILTEALQAHVLKGDIPPPNRESTIKKKGHDRTLFDSGVMIDAMGAKITRKK